MDSSEWSITQMKSECELPNDIKIKFEELLTKYAHTFATKITELGCVKGVEFAIETTSESPLHAVAYRLPQIELKAMENEINQLLKAEIIRKGSSGTWTAPAFLVKQKGKYRMVINYKPINKITIKYKHPLPIIDELLESFSGSKIFSIIDVRKGFHQISVREDCRHKTGFITPFGIYEYNRLPFGLSNGPAVFSAVMRNIFGDLDFVKVYIDDITIHSKNLEQHLLHLEIVFKRLNEMKIKINNEKCMWFAREIKILGHIIGEDGTKMDPEKIKPLVDRRPPTDKKQLQTFMGITNYYRKFCNNYAKVAAPLYRLLCADAKWEWNNEHQKAFEGLISFLTSYPTLRPPDFTKPFILYTDASHVALGGVLAQVDSNKHEYVICYISKILKDSERNYGISELECLCIVWCINKLWYYFFGNTVKIVTDNSALKWLFSNNRPNARLARWSVLLQQFDYEIIHRSGNIHKNADAISRPVLLTEIMNNENNLEKYDEETSLKNSDPYEDGCLMHYLKYKKHINGASKKQLKRVENKAKFFQMTEAGIIMMRNKIDAEFNILIPKPEDREFIILKEHELTHSRTNKIVDTLRYKGFNWVNMNDDVKKSYK